MITSPTVQDVKEELLKLHRQALSSGLSPSDLRKNFDTIASYSNSEGSNGYRRIAFASVLIFLAATITTQLGFAVDSFLGTRCLLPNNYLIWEATRPISDCKYCINVTAPLILWNVTKESFKKYAYTSRPIIAKRASSHWHSSQLQYSYLKRLYMTNKQNVFDDRCQFLSFKSDVMSPNEVFEMSDSRARNGDGEKPWYVGWGNCNPEILSEVRQYYDYPSFLPDDAEFPNSENIFFGYEMGAVMHLDYIPRLMWQGQVHGNKTWRVVPIPECEHACSSFSFYVEPGDVVLLDTRVWYHATSIPPKQFSLTIQSEYG